MKLPEHVKSAFSAHTCMEVTPADKSMTVHAAGMCSEYKSAFLAES